MKKIDRSVRRGAWHRFAVLPINLIFMEIIIRLLSGATFFGWGLIPMLLFSVVLGYVLSVLCSFFA